VFAPFAYDGLLTSGVRWDVLLIEGWTGPVPKVISALRAASRRVVVLHWCLDTYPDLATVTALDVDGFITNSRSLVATLGRLAPTLFLPLAADPSVMVPVQKRVEYDHPVVYLGQASHTKHRLLDVLSEVAPHGLAIYGLGWDRFEGDADQRFSALRNHWRGVLPKNDIAALYSSAAVVVGTTEEEQRALGMVNNRLFEALACGAAFVSDHFPALESIFADKVFYAKEPGDAARLVSMLLNNATAREAAAAAGRRHILLGQTYDHRVDELIPWLRSTFNRKSTQWRGPRNGQFAEERKSNGDGTSSSVDWLSSAPLLRPNRPSVTLVYDAVYSPFATSLARGFDLPLAFGLLPALSILEADQRFRLTLQPIDTTDSAAPAALKAGAASSDLLLIRASWDSRLRRMVSAMAANYPPFESLENDSKSSRGDRWRRRASLGILLAPHAFCESSAVLPQEELKAFDMVVHDTPSLSCSAAEQVSPQEDTTNIAADTFVLKTSSCTHSNMLHGLGIDLAALRDRSEGWDDGDLEEEGSLAASAMDGDWQHVVLGGLGKPVGSRALAILCDPLLRNASRAVLVPPSPLTLIDRKDQDAESEARRNAAALRNCGVEVRMSYTMLREVATIFD
jgi:hypothetical protein